MKSAENISKKKKKNRRVEWAGPADLKREAAIGFAQLKAGELVQVTTKEQFMSLARKGK